jgi:predicted regulator of Ras-like GTPase activity (Roadblock/LC7/MglB family)
MAADDIRAMSEALAVEPASLVFLPLAEALLARGEYSHAMRVATRGATRHAHRVDAHDLVARIALAQGDEERAIAAWARVLELAPGFATAHRGLGFIHYRRGEAALALAHLEAALAEDPADDSMLAAVEAVRAAVERTSGPAPVLAPVSAPVSAPVPTPVPAPVPEAAPPGADLPSPTTLFDGALGESAQVALLLEADGVVAAGHYETADGTDLGAVIGAHLSGVSDEAQRAMRHFGLGSWTRIVIETEAAVVAMAPAGEPVVLVAAPREVPLGFVRRTLDRCVAVARAWLGAFGGGT